MLCKIKSSPMTIIGSTIGAACEEYIFVGDGGRQRNLPRINNKCCKGMKGFKALQMAWLVSIACQSDNIAYEYALNNDPGLLALLSETNHIIPPELCIAGS